MAVISQQLQPYDGHLAVCPPKAPHSVRTIALDHTTVAALRAHRGRQRAEAAAAGAAVQGAPWAADRPGRPAAAEQVPLTAR